MPTREHYESLQRGLGNGYLGLPYETLLRTYENARRPFNATPDAPYTDVWDFATVNTYPGKHPCEKPLDMCRHIVNSQQPPRCGGA